MKTTIDTMRGTGKEVFTLLGMELVESPFVPEGHTLIVGQNSYAIVYPSGRVIAFRRKNSFSKWEVVDG